MVQDHFQMPPDPKKVYKKFKITQKALVRAGLGMSQIRAESYQQCRKMAQEGGWVPRNQAAL